MLLELLNCAFTTESMAAFKLNCTQLAFRNRLICWCYLVTVANTAIGYFVFFTLSCNVLKDFGSSCYNTLLELGNQSISHCVVIFFFFAVLEIFNFYVCGGVFHVETDLAEQHDIFWFGLLIFCIDGTTVFFVSCALKFTNVTLQRSTNASSFIVLVEILYIGLNKLVCLWKGGNERVAHLSHGVRRLVIIVILIVDPLHSAFNTDKISIVQS